MDRSVLISTGISGLDGGLLGSSRWADLLARFAEATGLAVTLYDAAGAARVGPFAPAPLASLLERSGGWGPGGACAAADAEAARAAVATGEVVVSRAVETLTVCGVPVALDGRAAGAFAVGWVFDGVPDPIACDGLAKSFGLAFLELWPVARQQPPFPPEKLGLFAGLLRLLGDAFLQELANRASEQEVARDLLVLNDTARRRLDDLERERTSLQAANASLERASRLKDEFLATVSHELRTPLNAILGWSEVLLSRQMDPATVTRALEAIERNARAQAQLVEDLLDVSRAVTGKLRIESRPVELRTVIEAAVEAVRPATDGKGVEVVADLGPSGLVVTGDETRLRQVVGNLLSNSVKFTSEGGRVSVRLVDAGGLAEIVVSDTGAGIDPEFLPYVFDQFRQADGSSTRAHGGLGLGLAIVHYLVEMHGGAVRAESEGRGRGAVFTVRLPLAAVEVAAEAAGEGAGRGATTFEMLPRLDGRRLLVVDDEPDARDVLATVLAGQGAEARAVASADEAVEAVAAWRPDLILSDIGMPGEDGYSLLRRVRALGAEAGGATPAVAVTAFARAEDRIRALAAGFDMHIPKPVDPIELVLLVAGLLGRK